MWRSVPARNGHRTYVGGLERGERNLTLKAVERIAQRLRVDPLDLLQKLTDGRTWRQSTHRSQMPLRGMTRWWTAQTLWSVP